MSDFSRDSARVGTAAVIAGVIALVVALLLTAMFVFGFGFFQRGTADFRGKNQAIEQTKANGSYRIAAYDQFFDLCASVQDFEGTIAVLEQELNDSPSERRIEQIKGALSANRIARIEAINTYNIDARKAGTRGQFRSSDLPFQLDRHAEETTCTAN